MEESRCKIPLVDEHGGRIGYGDRWWTHRVKKGADGPILGQKHVGITIAMLDERRRVLLQHRKHRIFDDVWSLSGDTHPRKYGDQKVETLSQAARRCAMEDWGVRIKNWSEALSLSYSARDPRDPKYCENELSYVMVSRVGEPVRMNRRNAYAMRWAETREIWKESRHDMGKKKPIDRKFAPWVHAVFSLPSLKVESELRV